eukprot:CAMPEP_0197036936 /NCGR_PEP_ID=MMETSP1384-20130603/14280_1 /TAXON_ID=29189 /ORGANISM="Ammonia sp." /LENGTH=269 /DNA_ID=CAMNT_0042467171 /DNA_START=82 /DNA_END=891 /DNA_ORIENTATION=+
MSSLRDFAYSRNLPLSAPWTPCLAIALYLCVIVVLSSWMRKRKAAYRLVHFSRIHNLILCAWSAVMFVGNVVSLSRHVAANASRMKAQHLVTDPNLEIYNLLQFWFYIYYLSKYYELIDTFVLILRKKRLIALHVWHHGIMLLCAWLWVDQKWTLSMFGMMINTFIHVLMYYYYFISSYGGRPWWRRYLTQLQLLQFVCVLISNTYWLYACPVYNGDWTHYDWLFGDVSCSRNQPKPWMALASYAVMLSFLVLFANFFRQQYVNKAKQT